jgi:hypothetical protein
MRTRASRGSNKALGVATDQFETTSDAVQPPIDTIEAQVVAGECLLQGGATSRCGLLMRDPMEPSRATVSSSIPRKKTGPEGPVSVTRSIGSGRLGADQNLWIMPSEKPLHSAPTMVGSSLRSSVTSVYNAYSLVRLLKLWSKPTAQVLRSPPRS